jgi:hypothetical protein
MSEGETNFTVEDDNGCGTKTDTIQVKATTGCYDYEFAQNRFSVTAICATSAINSVSNKVIGNLFFSVFIVE